MKEKSEQSGKMKIHSWGFTLRFYIVTYSVEALMISIKEFLYSIAMERLVQMLGSGVDHCLSSSFYSKSKIAYLSLIFSQCAIQSFSPWCENG